MKFFYSTLILTLSFVLTISCTDSVSENNSIQELSPTDSILVDHFLDISMGGVWRTYGPGDQIELPKVTRKWNTDIDIYIMDRAGNQDILPVISRTISELDSLRNDGFRVKLISDSTAANVYFFLGTSSAFEEQFDINDGLILRESGSWRLFFDDTSTIYRGYVLFNPWNPTNNNLTDHLIRETLGEILGFTSNTDSAGSIFTSYQRGVELLNRYSKLDEESIKLMYHPKMESGLDSVEVREKLAEILSEN